MDDLHPARQAHISKEDQTCSKIPANIEATKNDSLLILLISLIGVAVEYIWLTLIFLLKIHS